MMLFDALGPKKGTAGAAIDIIGASKEETSHRAEMAESEVALYSAASAIFKAIKADDVKALKYGLKHFFEICESQEDLAEDSGEMGY